MQVMKSDMHVWIGLFYFAMDAAYVRLKPDPQRRQQGLVVYAERIDRLHFG